MQVFFFGIIGSFIGGLITFYLWYFFNRRKIRIVISESIDVYNKLKEIRLSPSTERLLEFEEEFYEWLVAISKLIPITLPGNEE